MVRCSPKAAPGAGFMLGAMALAAGLAIGDAASAAVFVDYAGATPSGYAAHRFAISTGRYTVHIRTSAPADVGVGALWDWNEVTIGPGGWSDGGDMGSDGAFVLDAKQVTEAEAPFELPSGRIVNYSGGYTFYYGLLNMELLVIIQSASPVSYSILVDGRALPGSNTPEPSTWALLIAGFGGAGAALRRHARMGRPAA